MSHLEHFPVSRSFVASGWEQFLHLSTPEAEANHICCFVSRSALSMSSLDASDNSAVLGERGDGEGCEVADVKKLYGRDPTYSQ